MFLSRKFISIMCALMLVALPSVGALAAGGAIAGKIVDTRGAAVVGASVTVAETTSGQTQTATTNAEGRFKIEGLPPGIYTLTVKAKGFGEASRTDVRVEDGKSASVDVSLEVESLDAGSVQVSASGLKPNVDPVYQKIRQQLANPQDFAGAQVASVNNLVLKRDAATFTLRSGEIYFLPPVEGRTVGAVFIGDGELTFVPPIESEKKSLAIFTDEPKLAEPFSYLALRFTDQTFEEVKKSSNASMRQGGAQAERAREIYRDTQTLLRKRFRSNIDLRTLADVYAPERPGYFTAFIKGKRYEKLVFQLDPLGIPDVSPEEVMLMSYGETDGGIWAAFHLAEEYQKKTASSSEDNRLYDITRHEIDGVIKGTQITASDRLTLRTLQPGLRVVPFDLYRSLRVSRVQDESGQDLNFIQESKDEDADFAVIMPKALEVGKTQTLTVQYQGTEALRDSGGGNFILVPRSSWYPNNFGSQFGDRAAFEMTFRFPKNYTFVGVGATTAPDTRDGDVIVAKWSSGKTDLAVAGFNYGKFKKKTVEDKESGYGIEFYANEEVPDQLKNIQRQIDQAEALGIRTDTTLGQISTTNMADSALADAQNSMRIFNLYFGKLPYTRLAMTQQPAPNFGQAWPTLVYMPYTAFMDTTQRVQLFGIGGGTDNFWRYVAPHEVAHQWWGHIIGWTSYRDQWMSEGFAELSASLYVQYVRRDLGKFIDFWEEQRKQIVEAKPSTRDIKPYTVGPVTQGYRLNSGKTGATYQNLVYPKGAYILHMLRMMMYDQKTGDARFQKMMQDFVQTYFNKDVSTEDFKRIVEKHMTPQMNIQENGRMDWFFDQWVYGTEMPSYRLDYSINGNNLSARITQSGVSDNFSMLVPVYVDFGKGWARLGSATLTGNSSTDLNVPLPQTPKRAAICALNDVLAAKIEISKK